MSWDMNAKELESVIKLQTCKRYNYFLKTIVETEEVWSMKDGNGWVIASDEDGEALMPVWPHPTFASLCAIGAWQGTTPTPISFDDWMSKWLPGMIRDNIGVAVFPTPEDKGIVRTADELLADIESKLDNY